MIYSMYDLVTQIPRWSTLHQISKSGGFTPLEKAPPATAA
jgi:hypothetical protein